jgi:hypothetical protein
MTFSVGGGGGGDFKRIPAGTHLAVCNLVADIGLQTGFEGKAQHKVAIRWEVPDERVSYEKDGKKIEGPATITRTFTASMHEKSSLRKFLEGWRGKKFTDEEAKAFDVGSVLGKSCLLNITETDRNGETYSNVDTASPLIKGMQPAKAENPLIYYGADDRSKHDQLPKRLREKVEGQIKPKSEAQHDEEMAGFAHDDDPFGEAFA